MTALILFSWDGKSAPLASLARDAEPEFEIMLFDYSGTASCSGHDDGAHLISRKTECKGQIFAALHDHLRQHDTVYEYVALFDDDIEVSVSTLNAALSLARARQLDSFALSLTPCSYFSHKRFVSRPGGGVRDVPWVEVMMPFYRQSLFMAGGSFFANSISSYGIDQFVMPLLQKTNAASRIAILDAHCARHGRPVTSDSCIFSNGRTAHEERIVLRRQCLRAIARDHPQLLATLWYYRTFAPMNGPARFWPLYLGLPWHATHRLVSSVFRRHGGARMRHGPK